ncbi:MAG: hypothetical protein HYS15_03280, partial [Candidatus Spechtbacteria bacterium]|nr:hypothetical protein [Candidatus Spechtbacteria bacterium]
VPAPAGSLRACATASGPRICVFRVGGTIELESISGTRFEITNPYLTIAGQTAPGGGIVIKGYSGISIKTHDVIIRYLRVILDGTGIHEQGRNNIAMRNGAYNVIIDHCSTAWSFDESTAIWKYESPPSPDITGITVQRCVIAEGLAKAHGMNIGGNIDYGISPPSEEYLKVHDISVHHNLFVHNFDRNPRVKSAGTQVINNVVYNWGSRVGVSEAKNTVDFINNYWKPGPMSQSLIYKHESTYIGTSWVYPDPSIYIAGNIVKGSFENPSADNWPLIVRDTDAGFAPGELLPLSYRRYTPISQSPNPITIQSASDAYTSVLADAGANARLDCQGNWISNSYAVDIRVINDAKQGTGWSGTGPASPQAAGGFPVIAAGTACTDSDHDGMADEWETIQFGSLSRGSSTDSSGDFDADGYTDLEEYLNGVGILASAPTPTPTSTQTPTSKPKPTPISTPVTTPVSSPISTLTPTPISSRGEPRPSPSGERPKPKKERNFMIVAIPVISIIVAVIATLFARRR